MRLYLRRTLVLLDTLGSFIVATVDGDNTINGKDDKSDNAISG